MPLFPSNPRRHQDGGFLLESLIGLLLMAIIGMGAVSVTSRAQVAQAQAFSRQHVINQMRLILMNNKLNGISICPPNKPVVTLPDGTLKPVDVHNCGLTTVKVNNVDVAGVQLPLKLTLDLDENGQTFSIQVGGTLGQ